MDHDILDMYIYIYKWNDEGAYIWISLDLANKYGGILDIIQWDGAITTL